MRIRSLWRFGVAVGAGVVFGMAVRAAIEKVTAPPLGEPLKPGEPFPALAGTLLSGRPVSLPADAAGLPVILIAGWDYAARYEVAQWAQALTMAFGADRTDLTMYEVALIHGVGPWMRKMIDAAMVKGTPPEEQSHVLTVYGDLRVLRNRLRVSDPRMAQVYLIAPDGTLAWKTTGVPTSERIADLEALLQQYGVMKQAA